MSKQTSTTKTGLERKEGNTLASWQGGKEADRTDKCLFFPHECVSRYHNCLIGKMNQCPKGRC